jgi:asparagine synthase (glutamine-hydrolysing)
MVGRMLHRGPDGHAVVRHGAAILGHARLAIIDPTAASDQPMTDPQSGACIAFNGEIYNFKALRQELEVLGHRFITRGDTEVILAGWRQWGDAVVERLDGMFAFALWDPARRRLLLARDRCGEKPLFFAELPDGSFAFASEPACLLAIPSLRRDVDPDALGDYLSLNYTVADRTLVRSIRRLGPAELAALEESRPLQPRRYWDLASAFRRKASWQNADAAAEALRALLDETITSRLVSDVPLGAFLSGGIDSATVVGAMCEAMPRDKVRTFTIGFTERGFNEADQAKATASKFGVDHHERIQESTAEDVERALRWAAREPLADSSVLPTWAVARFARERVTVALSGDGGDEAFAGYPTYVADRLHTRLHWLPRPVVAAMRLAAGTLVPTTFGKVSFDYKLRQFLAGLPRPLDEAHWSWRTIFTGASMAALLRPEQRSRVTAEPGLAHFRALWREVEGCHWLDRATYVDFKTWLCDDILVKVDRATMASSLESRAPFLAHRVVEFAAALPPEWRLAAKEGKHILRRSQRARLGPEILDRPKRGFNAPVAHWFEGPLRTMLLDLAKGGAMDEWFEPSAIERLLEEHRARRRDHGHRLLGLLTLGLFLDGLRGDAAAA